MALTNSANYLNFSDNHSNVNLLHDIPRRVGARLTGELQQCTGCLMGNELREASPLQL